MQVICGLTAGASTSKSGIVYSWTNGFQGLTDLLMKNHFKRILLQSDVTVIIFARLRFLSQLVDELSYETQVSPRDDLQNKTC